MTDDKSVSIEVCKLIEIKLAAVDDKWQIQHQALVDKINTAENTRQRLEDRSNHILIIALTSLFSAIVSLVSIYFRWHL